MQTIEEIRHANLLLVIEAAGSIQAVADKLGKSHAQISQLKTRAKHAGSEKPRVMGSDMAREIEEAFELPRGWMDNPHDSLPGDDPQQGKLTFSELMSKLPIETRQVSLRMLKFTLAEASPLMAREDVATYMAEIDAVEKAAEAKKPS